MSTCCVPAGATVSHDPICIKCNQSGSRLRFCAFGRFTCCILRFLGGRADAQAPLPVAGGRGARVAPSRLGLAGITAAEERAPLPTFPATPRYRGRRLVFLGTEIIFAAPFSCNAALIERKGRLELPAWRSARLGVMDGSWLRHHMGRRIRTQSRRAAKRGAGRPGRRTRDALAA